MHWNYFFLLKNTISSYLGNEMISLGTNVPWEARTNATMKIPMHNCIPVCYDISFKSVQVEFALSHTYMCFVMSGKKFLSVVIFSYFSVIYHVTLTNCLLCFKSWDNRKENYLTWPSISLSTPPSSPRSRLQHAPRQCEGMWGGIWETKRQPHDVSHTDSDRQEQALVCVQRSHHYWVSG